MPPAPKGAVGFKRHGETITGSYRGYSAYVRRNRGDNILIIDAIAAFTNTAATPSPDGSIRLKCNCPVASAGERFYAARPE